MNIRKTIYGASLSFCLIACGGGESNTSAPVQPPQSGSSFVPSTVAASVLGIYDVDFGNFKGLYTLLDDGRFSGIHYVNDFAIVGSPHTLLNPGEPSTTVRPIVWSNFAAGGGLGLFENGARFTRTLVNGVLRVELSSEGLGTFSSDTKVQRGYGGSSNSSLYFDPISLASLAGNYSGEGRTVNFQVPVQAVTDFALDDKGNFSMTSANCTFKGNLTAHGSTGVFDVQAQTSGNSCRYLGALSGIVTPISIIDKHPRLGLQLDSNDYLESAVFVIRRN